MISHFIIKNPILSKKESTFMVKQNGNIIAISNAHINYSSALRLALNVSDIETVALKNNRIFSESIPNQLAKSLLDLGLKQYVQIELLTEEKIELKKVKSRESHIVHKYSPIDLGPVLTQFFKLVGSIQANLKLNKEFNTEGAIIPFLDKMRSAGVSTIGWNKKFYDPYMINVNDIKKLSVIGELSIVINETLTIDYLFNSESAEKDYNDLIKILDTKKKIKS